MLCVRLFDLCLFGFVCFLFLLGSWKGCGLWLWHYLDFSITFFFTSLFKQFLQKRLPLVIFWHLTSETRVLTPLTLAISWAIRKWLQPYQLTSKPRAHLSSPKVIHLPLHLKFSITKNVLQGLNTENITRNPSACSYKASDFCYNPAGYIIKGYLTIARINKLRDSLSKGPKYREPRCFTWKQNSKLILDSVEKYARRWAKNEDVEVDTLSEWVKSVMSLVNRRDSVLSRTMSLRHELVFDDPDVAAELAEIHEKFVIVPADKASNNIVFVCKTHHINCLMEELGMNTMTGKKSKRKVQGNPTYNLTAMSKDKILQNHHSVMLTSGISLPEEYIDLPKLYWIPKLHKNLYKQRYIAGSTKCSTKLLSQILTRIISAVKEGLQKYCDTAYAISGVNQMWILKNSKELLENLKAFSLHSIKSIKSFDFSTLYTTIPHDKLKSKLEEIINRCFFHKNGNRRFQYVVTGYKDTYFVRDHSDALQKYLDADVIKMLEYLIDNIFVEFGGQIFQSAYRRVLTVHRYLPTCF